MNESTTIQDDILQALYERGPLTRVEIMQQCFLEGDATRCGNALSRLKEKRLIERGSHKTWQLTDPHESTPQPAPERPHDSLMPTAVAKPQGPAAAKEHTIQSTLERAAQHAQSVLDEYVWAVGDESILGPLMASRDAAREALAAFESRA